MISREAAVFIFLPEDGYVPAGILEYSPSPEQSSFTYGHRYVKRYNALPLDPVRIPLSFKGTALTRRRTPMFNALRDAAPDRWGRKVLSLQAGRNLSEIDLLIAHHSSKRIGALAFGPNPKSGPCSMAPWAKFEDIFSRDQAQMLELANIIKIIEATPEDELDELQKRLPADAFLKALTSLFSAGGARPKAMVEFEGESWIAKFPKGDDIWDEPLIEHGAMTLAARCGINVANTRIIRVGEINVLLVKRFDRTTEDCPRHFISGFTAMDLEEDGDWGSYQDLAWAARRLGDDIAPEELFRRMVFNALVANTDDHPRNHAFFVHHTEVCLTPAYDIVPRQFRRSDYHLALRCGSRGTETTVENLLSQTAPFGLNDLDSKRILEEIQDVVSGWREHFACLGVHDPHLKELRYRFER